MFGIGIGEIILILVIGMLVVGPERMVQFSRQAGRFIAKLRSETDSVSREFREALDLTELQDALSLAQDEIRGVARDLEQTAQEVTAIQKTVQGGSSSNAQVGDTGAATTSSGASVE